MDAGLMIVLGPLLLGALFVGIFVIIPTMYSDEDDSYHNYRGDE